MVVKYDRQDKDNEREKNRENLVKFHPLIVAILIGEEGLKEIMSKTDIVEIHKE